jgi:hypothetical protein
MDAAPLLDPYIDAYEFLKYHIDRNLIFELMWSDNIHYYDDKRGCNNFTDKKIFLRIDLRGIRGSRYANSDYIRIFFIEYNTYNVLHLSIRIEVISLGKFEYVDLDIEEFDFNIIHYLEDKFEIPLMDKVPKEFISSTSLDCSITND